MVNLTQIVDQRLPLFQAYWQENCPFKKQILLKQRLLTSSLQDKSLRNSEQRFLCRVTTQNGVSTLLSSILLVNVDHSDIMSILTRQQNRC